MDDKYTRSSRDIVRTLMDLRERLAKELGMNKRNFVLILKVSSLNFVYLKKHI